MLHVSTNDAVIDDSGVIITGLLNLKTFIQKKPPDCRIIFSCLTLRTDLDKYLKTIEEDEGVK